MASIAIARVAARFVNIRARNCPELERSEIGKDLGNAEDSRRGPRKKTTFVHIFEKAGKLEIRKAAANAEDFRRRPGKLLTFANIFGKAGNLRILVAHDATMDSR